MCGWSRSVLVSGSFSSVLAFKRFRPCRFHGLAGISYHTGGVNPAIVQHVPMTSRDDPSANVQGLSPTMNAESRRRASPAATGVAPLGPRSADISVEQFCEAVIANSDQAQIDRARAVVADARQQRGFSMALDTAVALCVLRFYTRQLDSVVALVTSLHDVPAAARFLGRMAHDSLQVIPSTPSSVGTMWQQLTPSLNAVSPLRTVSRAMRDCQWDLSDTITVDVVPAVEGQGVPPDCRLTYYTQPPLPSADAVGMLPPFAFLPTSPTPSPPQQDDAPAGSPSGAGAPLSPSPSGMPPPATPFSGNSASAVQQSRQSVPSGPSGPSGVPALSPSQAATCAPGSMTKPPNLPSSGLSGHDRTSASTPPGAAHNATNASTAAASYGRPNMPASTAALSHPRASAFADPRDTSMQSSCSTPPFSGFSNHDRTSGSTPSGAAHSATNAPNAAASYSRPLGVGTLTDAEVAFYASGGSSTAAAPRRASVPPAFRSSIVTDSIVTDTAAQPIPPLDPLDDCLNTHMGEAPQHSGASPASLSSLNQEDISAACSAATEIDGTGELRYFTEDYAAQLLKLMPGARLRLSLISFIESAVSVMHYMDIPGYVNTCVALVSAAPLEAREAASIGAPNRIISAAKQRAVPRGMGSGPPPSHSKRSQGDRDNSDFDAALITGRHAAQQDAVATQRRLLAEERVRLDAQAAQYHQQALLYSGQPQWTYMHPPPVYMQPPSLPPPGTSLPLPACGSGTPLPPSCFPCFQPPSQPAATPAALPEFSCYGAQSATSPAPTPPSPPPPDVAPTSSPPPPSATPKVVPSEPRFYSNTMGAGRTPSRSKLRLASTVLASCSFSKTSLKTPSFNKADLVKLINCDFDDYDAWLPSRPEVLERMLKFYYQRFYILYGTETTSESADPSACESAALEDCRDLLRDGIAESPKLARVHERVRKARTDDPGEDLVRMRDCIDQHAVPSGAAAITLSIEKRRLRLGEESISTYLESLINRCAGHVDPLEVRRKFIVNVSMAMDDAEKSGLYNIVLIDNVRDNVLSDDASLPASNDDLCAKLEKLASTSRIWTRAGSAPGPARGAKEARTFEGWAGHYSPPAEQPPAVPAPGPAPAFQPPPSTPPPPAAPPPAPMPPKAPPMPPAPVQDLSQRFQDASLADGRQADAFYGGAQGYQQKGGGGYGGGRGGGRGYGGDRGGYSTGRGFGKGDSGKGGGAPKDPNGLTKFYDFPAIIDTGLIWAKGTKLFWDNPARIGSDGSGDGLYGLACPLCGTGKTRELTWDNFISEFEKPPGNGPQAHPQPKNMVVFHRGLGCREGGWAVERYVRDHANDSTIPACMTTYMTEGALAQFKTLVP